MTAVIPEAYFTIHVYIIFVNVGIFLFPCVCLFTNTNRAVMGCRHQRIAHPLNGPDGSRVTNQSTQTGTFTEVPYLTKEVSKRKVRYIVGP